MNISEANDVNTLLRWLTGDLPPADPDIDEVDHALLLDQQAQHAAERLADRAHKALHCGLTAERVHEAWDKVSVG